MPNVRISDMPLAQTLTGAELIEITQNGKTRNARISQLLSVVAPPESGALVLVRTDPPDLVDTLVALNVGAVDPNISQHLEFGPAQVQSKANAVTASDLSINALGGSVNIGQQSGEDSESEVNIWASNFLKAIFSSAGPTFMLANDGDPSSSDVMQGGIELSDRSGDESYAYLGYSNGVVLQLINRAYGGLTQLVGTDGEGEDRVGVTVNPDADVRLRHPASDADVVRTATGESGGLFVDNSATGGGFERVLTTSDLSSGGGDNTRSFWTNANRDLNADGVAAASVDGTGYYNSSQAYTITLEDGDSSLFTERAYFTVQVLGAGIVSIARGDNARIMWLTGTETIEPLTNSLDIGPGGFASIYRGPNDVWTVFGSGISATPPA